MRPLLFYGQICYGTLEPVAAEQGEASTGVVEVATTSARVERIQAAKVWQAKLLTGRKNLYMIEIRKFRTVCTMVAWSHTIIRQFIKENWVTFSST